MRGGIAEKGYIVVGGVNKYLFKYEKLRID